MITTKQQLAKLPDEIRQRLRSAIGGDRLSQLWLAPHEAMRLKGSQADAWQVQALRGLITLGRDTILCCSRGAGKSEVVSCAAYLEACLGGRVVVFSRSDRQAMEEVFEKVIAYHKALHLVPQSRRPTMHDLRLTSGGRVLSLPCSEATVVGKHKISLLIIDEAATVPDRFYARVTPMISIRGDHAGVGRVCALSTPFGKRGFFWKAWEGKNTGRKWHRVGPIDWTQCPRITPEHIQRERGEHGDWWVDQEYGCKFAAAETCFFGDLVDRFDSMVDPELKVWH